MIRTDSFSLTSADKLPAYVVTALALTLAALAVWLSRVSIVGFAVLAVLLLALIAYASLRWPRTVLVLVAMSAILDRYVVAGLLPTSYGFATHITSETLLAVAGITITWTAWQSGTLLTAFRHPATIFFGLFLLVAAISTVINRVPIAQAMAGVIFTADAVALFYLARMVTFSPKQAMAAILALVALLVVASALAVLQALLDPNLLGLNSLVGRFGEPYRLASIFGDPNVFAALLSTTLPFAIAAAVRAPLRRDRWIAAPVVLLLALALWLTFSRGGWIGMIIGFSLAGLILDRRVLLAGAAALVVAYAIVAVMPRDLAVSKSNHQAENPVTSTQSRFETVGRGEDLRTLFLINGIPILADHKLVGVGPGRYGGAAADIFGTPIYTEYRTNLLLTLPDQRTVDNFWLHLFVEFGVLGGLAFVGMMLVIGVPILRAAAAASNWRRVLLFGIAAAALTIIVNSFTTMLLEANSVSFVFWFILGLGSTLAAATGIDSELPAAQDLPQRP
jgi:O-antigen ligase